MIMRMKTGLLQPIIKKVLVILPFYLFAFLPLTAQTFTQRIQKNSAGEGTITIHQDTAIDELVNGPVPTPKPISAPKKMTPTPVKTAVKAKETTTAVKEKETTAVKAKETTVAPVKEALVSQSQQNQQEADTTLITPKRVFKTVGYRVQVMAGGNTRRDRQRAEQAGRSLRTLFPGEEVYVHFYSPRWICRLGNYRTYEEAHEKMLEVRKLGYDAATVVKGKITVTESIK
jgi:hypothetical protein